MKQDVIKVSEGKATDKRLSKETLNNRELIHMASGIDPVNDTKNAYLEAYRALGIDFINRVPLNNCSEPLEPGDSQIEDETYKISSLGLYGSYYRYAYPYHDVETFLKNTEEEPLDYHKLKTPVPHSLSLEDISRRQEALKTIGCYYYQLYTTLFMWGIEYLGWEVYMLAIAMDPESVDKKILIPGFRQTLELTETLLKSESESPYIFFHDDIAIGSGIVYKKSWLDKYIFPRYSQLWEKVHAAGKKAIFVCDGNADEILQNIADTGVDGVMLENPATSFEKILETFSNKLIIGGIDTHILTQGTPNEVSEHVHEVMNKVNTEKFVIASCGGIHGGIPKENLEAYFDTRAEYSVNEKTWRYSDR